MMARPLAKPTWATDTNYTNGPSAGTPTKVAPAAAAQAEGWRPSQKPPAQYQNWWENLVGQWIAHLLAMQFSRADDWSIVTSFVASQDVGNAPNIAFLQPSALGSGVDAWVMVDDSDVFKSSQNGRTWTTRAHTATTGIIRGVFGLVGSGVPAGCFLVVTENGEIRRSVDGQVWTAPTNPSPGVITDAASNPAGNLVLAQGTTPEGFLTSPDGVTWTVRDSGEATAAGRVTWDGARFIALGNAWCRTSSDGVTWTSRTSPFTGTKSDARSNPRSGYTLVANTSGDLYRTNDGDTWVSLGAGPGVGTFGKLFCHDGIWIYLRGTVEPGYWSDDDGTTWHPIYGFLTTAVTGVAGGQGGFLYVQASGGDTVLYTSLRSP